ncbi:MAG: baseplate J/gp47 family protein [Muribaculum sp.]|nr:baseplate J/gp47 family protein [Ruminococcus flavefaciens]MCM1373617.1 baseplate J/gp47 family protein [Muribaculum sp.]
MYEHETYEVILDRMLARVSDALDKRPSSPIYDTHSVTAIELQILYIELETLIQNSYGDTAAREFLILLAKDRGLSPDPATHALLKGVFTPTTIDVTGQRFNIGDMNYTVLEQTAPGQYRVQCESTGEIGNQYLGQMIPMEYIPGLETATLTEVLIPGEDDEDTEVFRQRYFDSFNEQTFGGNRADYLAKVRGVDGVGDCKVIRVWNGDIRPAEMIPNATVQEWFRTFQTANEDVKKWLTAVYTAALQKKLTVGGTVKVVIVDSDDYGAASSALVQSVQQVLDPETDAGEGLGLAPIGHVVSVASADAVGVQIKTTVTFEEGYGWSNTKTAMEEAVSAYLLELRKAWSGTSQTIVRISQVETRILGVKGIVDVTGTKINGSGSNLTLGKYEIPVLGGVSS